MNQHFRKLFSVLVVLLFGATFIANAATADPDPNFHIYICWGQSNMEGNATVPDAEKTGVSDRFQVLYSADDCSNGDRKLGQWYTATPPLARCFHWNNSGFGPVDYFGRTLVEKLDPSIKVGVIVVACGGADIQLFEKDKYQSYLNTCADWLKGYANSYGGNPYGRIIDLAKQAQKVGVIKGILVHQGETNTNQSDWPSRLNGVYKNMLTDLGLKAADVPLLVGEVRYTGPCSSHNNQVRKVPDVIPTAHVVSADGCEAASDEYHFSVAGYKLLGKRYAETMLKLLGDNPVASTGISLSAIVNQESEPGEVEINVNVDNQDITKVNIYADDKLVAEGKTSFTWTQIGEGTHTIYAVGYDRSNKEYKTSAKEITIMPEQKPYNGKPATIPGIIQAEEFDLGGEGNAYHDLDEQNRNKGSRNEGVDMDDNAVGYNQVGEWLEYTVNVEEDGDYVVVSNVASDGTSGQFTLYMDNQFIIPGEDGTPGGFVDVPNTGSYTKFTKVTTKLNKLTKGTHVLKLEVTGNWFDIDYLEFKLASAASDDDDNNNNNNNNNTNNQGTTPAKQELLTGVTTGKYVDIYVNKRQVSVYAPNGIHTNRPLLISCHGMNQDIKYQREQTQWELVADTADFVVAYPQSDGNTWDISGTKDTDFLIAIINELSKTHKIDLTRVYLSGFSMGGMLTYHCMNSIPDYFAAFAPISGYYGSDVNTKTRAVPLIHTHGTGDDVVVYNANSSWIGAPATVDNWQKHNNCTTKSTKTVDCATQTIYSGGDCEADCILATVPNRGHIPANDCYHTSREIWKFVSQYSTACGKVKPTIGVNVELTKDAEPGEATISATIIDENIKSVDIYVDRVKQASGKSSCTVDGLTAGTHSVLVYGYDSNNKEYAVIEKVFTIYEQQKPFNGVAAEIPGKIEAEEFDFGGEGNAYHDNDEQNRNGDTRNEGVDMSATAIGYTQTGEWLEYTVNVATSGTYEMTASVASGNDGASFKLYMDNVAITGEIKVPNTGDWKTFKNVSEMVELKSGEQILKLEITGDYLDMDYMNFKLESPNGVEAVLSEKAVLNGEYEVYDVLGNRLMNTVVTNNKIDLKRGFYILRNVETNTYRKVVVR